MMKRGEVMNSVHATSPLFLRLHFRLKLLDILAHICFSREWLDLMDRMAESVERLEAYREGLRIGERNGKKPARQFQNEELL
jgi:hypothetical protein